MLRILLRARKNIKPPKSSLQYHRYHHQTTPSKMTQLTFSTPILEAGNLTATQTGNLLRVEITREKALNALHTSTFLALHHILDVTTASPPVHIILRGRGRAFSAGGDVRVIREKAQAAGPIGSDARRKAVRDTLKTEYDLLERWAGVQGSGVVTVAVGDGLAFGAGAGLFQACAVRLVSEKFLMSMPEVKIGIVPDCGASRFFVKMEGSLGMFAALTGWNIGGADAVRLGLADGGIPVGWFGEGVEGEGEEPVKKCFIDIGGETELADGGSDIRRGIDQCFSKGSFEEIVEEAEKVAAGGAEWAKEALDVLKGASPTALRETFMVMKEGYKSGQGSLKEALDRELEVDTRLAADWDFEEGVRALLVDKDGAPKWKEYSR